MVNSTLRQHPERGVPGAEAEILAAGHVAHVAFVEDGQPYVMPFAYHYGPETPRVLYVHGAQASRALERIGDGAPVCATVTLLDGLVYSRSAMFHSMNYRSVVCFGRGVRVLDPDAKNAVFDRMIARYFEGRIAGRDYVPSKPEQLTATTLVAVMIENWSAKQRIGGPRGPQDTAEAGLGSAGVVDFPPLTSKAWQLQG